MRILPALAAALLVTAPAAAGDDFPEECQSTFTVVVLGTVMHSCPELRVTAAGLMAVSAASKQKQFERCKIEAQARVLGDIAGLAEALGGDAKIAMRNWCDNALAASDVSGGLLIERR